MRSALLALAVATLPQFAAAQAHHVSEQEPNDTTAQATRIALGDSVSGDISNRTDHDFFAIDLPAGVTLRMARPVGNVWYVFYDTDGITRLGSLSPAWTIDHPDSSHFAYPITRSGTYYIRANAAFPEADVSIMGPYSLKTWTEPLTVGRGDPATVLADLPELATGQPVRLAAGPQGEVFVAFRDNYSASSTGLRILRIGTDGSRIWIQTDLHLSGGFALDGFGDLLVSGTKANDTANYIWRVHASDGSTERITAGLGRFGYDDGKGSRYHIAVAPDGDFWAGQVATLRHFDPLGLQLEVIPLAPKYLSMFSLAVSPTGLPHFVSYHGIYRVNNNQLVEQVVADSVGELAFDREGNLYVGNWGNYDPIYWGHVIQYDAAYRFAGRVANVPYLNGLLFARDERGEMTSRLLTIQDAFIHHLITLADGAALAPGSGVGVRLHRADFITLRAGIVGSAYLDTLRTTSTSDSVSWSVAAGALPPGVHLSSAGVLSGTPITNGTFLFAARGLHGAEVWYGHATLSIQAVSISLNQIVDALLGGPPLSAALVGWLDGQCNHNGQLDIGDLRCYARLNAALPSSH